MEHKNLIIFIVVAAIIVAVVCFVAFQGLPGLYKEERESVLDNDISLTAIEKDLMSTEISDLDGEFADIDAELEAAIDEAQ